MKFSLSDGKSLTLSFPATDTCYLLPDALGSDHRAPSKFRNQFEASIGFVPVLGPVDQDELLYNVETARRALFNYRAARNFRNIWHHYPEPFDEFREAILATWPGMDVALPETERIEGKVYLKMYCPEDRIDREIVWSGFGFQVWCQMLTHLVQGKKSSIFLIDEPDIYLHSDLQRQLVALLRELGPDIVIATHSTEIVTEAEPGELVIINKKKKRAKRIRDQGDLGSVFNDLGSNVNPILTQIAKTKKAVFVEGLDFQILSRFARRLGYNDVANRANFGVIPMDGFNPQRAQNIKEGIELTLGSKINVMIILDRDYRSEAEVAVIRESSKSFSDAVFIHSRKEIENFLLVPQAIQNAAEKRMRDREARGAKGSKKLPNISEIILRFADEKRAYIQGQIIALRQRHAKNTHGKAHPDSLPEQAINEFDSRWNSPEGKIALIPGKEALSQINSQLQQTAKINVTPSSIVSAMAKDEVPSEMQELIRAIDEFS